MTIPNVQISSPIENLWRLLKVKVMKKEPRNYCKIGAALSGRMEERLTVEECTNLVNNYNKRLNHVLANKGHKIDY